MNPTELSADVHVANAAAGGAASTALDAGVPAQVEAFERLYGVAPSDWWFHDTPQALIRYLRDRRLNRALQRLREYLGHDLSRFSALTVCGGVGGEATLLRRAGFSRVTNSDFSAQALAICRQRDPAVATLQLDAQALALADGSFDVVVVQDGLHHLPRPVTGFNEMLRVARRAVLVLEPHTGAVGTLLGTRWEVIGDTVNHVFRWDRRLLEQATLSQLLQEPLRIEAIRLWDHSSFVHRLVEKLGGGQASLWAARALYAALTPLDRWGNNFIGLVVRQQTG